MTHSTPSLESLRASLTPKAQTFVRDNSLYPHWKAPDNTTTVLRFLPDGDKTNPMFWREKHMISIPFKGIAGTNHTDEVTVQVPCVTMYNKKCPIIEAIRPWWKDEAQKPAARIYNKKTSYLFQGIVRESHFTEEDAPESIVRRFNISKSIYNIIYRGVFDPEMEKIPTDYDRGTDFKVYKIPGTYGANYDSSSFARKESALTESERAAIEQVGLYNMSDYLPKEPTPEQVNLQFQMFQDSLNGLPYDPAKYASTYAPYSFQYEHAKIEDDVMDYIKSHASGTGTMQMTENVQAVPTNMAYVTPPRASDIVTPQVQAPVQPVAQTQAQPANGNGFDAASALEMLQSQLRNN